MFKFMRLICFLYWKKMYDKAGLLWILTKYNEPGDQKQRFDTFLRSSKTPLLILERQRESKLRET